MSLIEKDLIRDYQYYAIQKADYENILQKNPLDLLATVALKRINKDLTFIEKAFKANDLNIQQELNKFEMKMKNGD